MPSGSYAFLISSLELLKIESHLVSNGNVPQTLSVKIPPKTPGARWWRSALASSDINCPPAPAPLLLFFTYTAFSQQGYTAFIQQRCTAFLAFSKPNPYSISILQYHSLHPLPLLLYHRNIRLPLLLCHRNVHHHYIPAIVIPNT